MKFMPMWRKRNWCILRANCLFAHTSCSWYTLTLGTEWELQHTNNTVSNVPNWNTINNEVVKRVCYAISVDLLSDCSVSVMSECGQSNAVAKSNSGRPSRPSSQYVCIASPWNITLYTVSQKKLPTFKLFVTLSNLNRYSKFLHCWKAYEICYKPFNITRLNLDTLLHYLGKLQFQIFYRYSAHMEENTNKLNFKCTDFHLSTHVTVYAECICVFFIKILFSSLNTMLIVSLKNTAVTSAVTNFRYHKLIEKVNK